MDFSRFNAAEQAQLNKVIEKKQESWTKVVDVMTYLPG